MSVMEHDLGELVGRPVEVFAGHIVIRYSGDYASTVKIARGDVASIVSVLAQFGRRITAMPAYVGDGDGMRVEIPTEDEYAPQVAALTSDESQ
jgi:hypothetical protein